MYTILSVLIEVFSKYNETKSKLLNKFRIARVLGLKNSVKFWFLSNKAKKTAAKINQLELF